MAKKDTKDTADNAEKIIGENNSKAKDATPTSLKNELLNLNEDELLKNIPDIKELEVVDDTSESPLEVKVADETGIHSDPMDDGTGDDITTGFDNDEVKTTEKTEPVATKKHIENAGDIDVEVELPEKKNTVETRLGASQTTNTQQQKVNQQQVDKEKFKVDGLTEPTHAGTGQAEDADFDIFNIEPKSNSGGAGNKSGGGGGNKNTDNDFGGGAKSSGGGGERSEEAMQNTNEGLSKTIILWIENKIIGGLRKKAMINVPKFIRDMTFYNVRKDIQDGFLRDVDACNERVENAIRLNPQEKQLLKHNILQVLEKYPMISEAVGPELQLLWNLGEIGYKYWEMSNEWKDAQLDLLDRMDERLARAPKDNFIREEKTDKKESKK